MARIGIDCRLWNETGVGRYIRNLVWQLEKIDTKNEYVLFFRKAEFESVQLTSKNFEKKLADIQWHTISEQINLPKILEKEHLDLMHFPYFSVPFLYNRPYIVTIHDLILHHYPTGKASTKSPFVYYVKYLGYRLTMQAAIMKAKKIITVSQATKGEIISHLHVPQEKIHVTYEGVDTHLVAKKNLSFTKVTKYFLYVGNAYPHKNLEKLILAFAMLRQKVVEPIHLVFVGKEDYFYKRLKQFVRDQGLSSHIYFYEHISDTDLSLLYQHAVALVLPSLMEGFGLPALEAMANNCRVVASNIPSIQEICKDSAEYFNPQDKEDIFHVLEEVLYTSSEYRKAKISEGKDLAKKFSWLEMAKESYKIYESCIGIR